jgi:membrane protein
VHEQDRGREASRPAEIPAKGWKDVLWRAWKQSGEDNMGIIAGGVTYGVLLALFPGLAALVSVFGLMADPAQIQEQMNAMAGLMPAESQKLIGDELKQLTEHASGTLSIGVIVGFLIALWSASRGVSALITALNIAYGEKETRGVFKFNLLTIALTIGLIIAGLIAIALIAGMPAILGLIGVGQTTRWLLLVLEWPVVSAFIMLVLAVLYRFAPNAMRHSGDGYRLARWQPPWRGSSPLSCSPSTWPTSTATTRHTARSARSSFC